MGMYWGSFKETAHSAVLSSKLNHITLRKSSIAPYHPIIYYNFIQKVPLQTGCFDNKQILGCVSLLLHYEAWQEDMLMSLATSY